jgi:hypothetical protein
MLGLDTLPFRQQDWPLPVAPPRLDPTWMQGFNPNLATVIVLIPHNQFDWPLPVQPARIDQSWTWRQVGMSGQDVLPFRQQDWQLPMAHQGSFVSFAWAWRQQIAPITISFVSAHPTPFSAMQNFGRMGS